MTLSFSYSEGFFPVFCKKRGLKYFSGNKTRQPPQTANVESAALLVQTDSARWVPFSQKAGVK
jgi:hypothetical protein